MILLCLFVCLITVFFICLHNFSGADWGGKFIGVSKKTWVDSYLSLDDNDKILDYFASFGVHDISQLQMNDTTLSAQFVHLERFVCMTYSPNGATTLASLRWKLLQSRNLEGELLPPTVATLFPHIKRANYISTRDKSYISAIPNLPKLEDNGWKAKEDGTSYEPVHCLLPPAPTAVVELVKCGCKKTCTGNCSCSRNNLLCTALCKCFSWGYNKFSNVQKTSVVKEDAEDEDE